MGRQGAGGGGVARGSEGLDSSHPSCVYTRPSEVTGNELQTEAGNAAASAAAAGLQTLMSRVGLLMSLMCGAAHQIRSPRPKALGARAAGRLGGDNFLPRLVRVAEEQTEHGQKVWVLPSSQFAPEPAPEARRQERKAREPLARSKT